MTPREMAANCEAAADRLAETGAPADLIDAAALRAAAVIHRRNATQEPTAADTAEQAETPAPYWWQDRD